MKKAKEHPWIKLKKYPHIGLPLNRKDIPMLENYIMDASKIAKHSFLPFLHRTIFQRKFRANDSNKKNRKSKRRERSKSEKVREIYFASHFDAQIYSYYSFLLSKKYNELLKKKTFNNSVVAYRKIEIEGEKDKFKCNIDFAKEAFEFIKANKRQKLSVIVADVSRFFDCLDHKILKQKWIQVWDKNSKTLPDDHYSVYKSLVKMRYVNEDLLFRNYKNKLWVSTKAPNDPKTTINRQKPIKHKRFLKDNNAIAFCKKDEFFKNSINLISKTKNDKGIPQGTALSATLANIYMLDFDQKVQDFINEDEVNGFYQRYSDDLIIVVPRNKQQEAIKRLRSLIKNKVKLEIHQKKTKVYHFEEVNGNFSGFEVDEQTHKVKNKNLEYLGFEYDGQKVLIKTAGYSKFYRSMKRTFKRKTSLAINSKSTDDKIHKSFLYKKFTHRGSKRRMVFSPKTKSYHYDWGNYLSYVEKANDKFRKFNSDNSIKKQSRKSWSKFHDLLRKSQLQIDKSKNGL